RFAGKEKTLSFGPYGDVKLAEAPDLQVEARRLLRQGIDPGEFKKQQKRLGRIAAANTFESVAREWFAKVSAGLAATHVSKQLARLENDLLPWLGRRPIADLEPVEILEALRRIEGRGAIETAHRCLGICSQVFLYAIATSRAKS